MIRQRDLDSPVSVVFLMGFRQSGTTIMASVLGSMERFTDLGEVHNVWGQRGRGWPKCGCQLSVSACPFWGQIVVGSSLEELPSRPPLERHPVDPRPIEELRTEWERRWRKSRLGLGRLHDGANGIGRRYMSVMEQVYNKAAAKDGRLVVVDSSKNPAYAALLNWMPGVESHLVHVVRDPRAALWSRLRKSRTRSVADESPVLAARFAASWMRTNLLSEIVMRNHDVGSTTRVRYEDFIADPERTLRQIAALTDVEAGTLPLQGTHTAVLRAHHTASGNARVRFKSGPVELRLDDEWRSGLDPSSRRAVTALTSPLLIRYRYPLSS